ncbi:small ribosomal subunit protein bS16 [Candidatus Carsonella ruddii]|uniref:30S ribosomal protein S16 n=1 Tax=Candidatus Carsonella ruddii (Diaphorina cf. continua) TaxID=2661587 RepID=A0A7R6VZP1_CARRU|nr:30S ribosomal protein S16 [Candidatus Carsonella ruddii (Diaphorina cf. continua)]BCG49363.1 30S ribosomal protein S16 [Candidatus Carsonella ruddii (Diaphorina cf. continua)]
MVVIRLTKKNKIHNFYYINVMYKKKSIFGKIIKRIGFYNSMVNCGKCFYINYDFFLYYIKKGAKMSKRLFKILIK